MNGSFPTPEGPKSYFTQGVPSGFSLMFEWASSPALGIGSGAVKVIAMDQAMHLPFQVSTTTSNFMIGKRRRQSRRLCHRGYIDRVWRCPSCWG